MRWYQLIAPDVLHCSHRETTVEARRWFVEGWLFVMKRPTDPETGSDGAAEWSKRLTVNEHWRIVGIGKVKRKLWVRSLQPTLLLQGRFP